MYATAPSSQLQRYNTSNFPSSPAMLSIPLFLSLFILPTLSLAHSTLSFPEPIAPMTCRLGGEPHIGIQHCHGPCDLTAIRGNYANHASPSNPAATFARGQTISLKYQRNNHAPGGFIRVTLVSPSDIMNKEVHRRNAFHYSCWGAQPVVATTAERQADRFGYRVVGNDGDLHSFPPAYYVSRVTIPPVVPDGDYILGWLWNGGVGGDVHSNRPQRPTPYGYFADYWGCAFVRIRGGAPLASSFTPVFVNDMRQYSTEGCMAANDREGVCSWEPCHTNAIFQKPAPFKNGRTPAALTPAHFDRAFAPKRAPPSRRGGGSSGNRGAGHSEGEGGDQESAGEGQSVMVRMGQRACLCLTRGRGCRRNLARKTGGVCVAGRPRRRQSNACRRACCRVCRGKWNGRGCRSGEVRAICRI